jgi:hypothetical protein
MARSELRPAFKSGAVSDGCSFLFDVPDHFVHYLSVFSATIAFFKDDMAALTCDDAHVLSL